ncbi:arginine--tRNA ligase [Candidatus Woesearchaeota archaeon]|nr:arginine--tRNA ligase [Candidatus Woesearchaeota archaeon]
MLFAEEVARLISKAAKRNIAETLSLLEAPPDPKLGDLAYPCFSLAKELKKAPALVAQELAQQVKQELPIDVVISAGPYLNFFLNKSMVAEAVLTKRNGVVKRKERVMVEHSNGNTHKEVHIGHLRNLSLGDSLVRIMRAAGFPVVNAYYINDTGAHVAKCLWALLRRGGEPPAEKRLTWLAELYREGARRAAEDEEAKQGADEVLRHLEADDDKEVAELWRETRQWSLDDWHRIFSQLGMLPFDAQFYDSEVIKDVPRIVARLQEKGIVRESEGALIADLEEEGLHVVIIRKQDGTTPYLAKDLALAERKFNEYDIERSVYVVGAEQELHFQQLFKLLEKDGFRQAKKCHHLSYGLVMLSSGKMSSREGKVVLFDDLYADVLDHALHEVKLRHEDWDEKKQAKGAKAVALAALKFPMLAQEPSKRIVFDIKKSLDFEGETGPYVQYTYARLSSIIRKHGRKITERVDFSVLCAEEEQVLIKLLAQEQDVVQEAAEKYRPALIARYALDVSQAVNTYYHAYHILKEAADVKKARLLLAYKAREAIGRVLELLGIPSLEEM